MERSLNDVPFFKTSDVPMKSQPLTRPKSVAELKQRLEDARGQFPKRLLQCADHIALYPERVALATVADLSQEAGVSPSAMMRFSQSIGFDGYTDMQKMFRAEMSQELPDYQTRLKRLQESGAGSPSALLAEFVEAGRGSLERLATAIDQCALDQSVARLAEADMIHLIGLRRAYPVASYMAYAFEKMEIPSILHEKTGKLDFYHAMRPGDAVIAVTFSPYSEETLMFVKEAQGRGLPVVLITDQGAPLSDHENIHTLLVPEVDFGAFRSLSATLTVAISLAVAVGAYTK